MTIATKARKMILKCENGHHRTFYVDDGSRYTRDEPGSVGEFATGEVATRVARDSYAYTHGGCCYRAAVDALWGLA
jgi:hypothetical protein